jgi:HTH-like domain
VMQVSTSAIYARTQATENKDKMVNIQHSLSFRATRGILRANHAPALIRFLPVVEMTTKSSFLRKGAE